MITFNNFLLKTLKKEDFSDEIILENVNKLTFNFEFKDERKTYSTSYFTLKIKKVLNFNVGLIKIHRVSNLEERRKIIDHYMNLIVDFEKLDFIYLNTDIEIKYRDEKVNFIYYSYVISSKDWYLQYGFYPTEFRPNTEEQLYNKKNMYKNSLTLYSHLQKKIYSFLDQNKKLDNLEKIKKISNEKLLKTDYLLKVNNMKYYEYFF